MSTPAPTTPRETARAAARAHMDLLNELMHPTEWVGDDPGLSEPDAQKLIRAHAAAVRAAALAERALAVSWSEWDESVPPRERIRRDMQELTEVADPDHRARRCARIAWDLDALTAEARTAAFNEAADWLDAQCPPSPDATSEVVHGVYGCACESSTDLRRLAAAAAPTTTPTPEELNP